jgi:hypothetical protein
MIKYHVNACYGENVFRHTLMYIGGAIAWRDRLILTVEIAERYYKVLRAKS